MTVYIRINKELCQHCHCCQHLYTGAPASLFKTGAEIPDIPLHCLEGARTYLKDMCDFGAIFIDEVDE